MEQRERTENPEEKKSASKQLFFVLLLTLVVLVTGFSFMISPAFSVGTVAVEGNRYLTQDEVYQIAGIPEKINIFRINTDELQLRLLKDLRIESASIKRQFPSTIVIRVRERSPIAYMACGYGFVEVDRDGMVLAAYRTMKQIRVPMVTGVTLHDLYVGDKVDNASVLPMLEYLSYMDEAAINQMSEINVQEGGQYVAYTRDSVQIRIGTADRLQEKAKLTQEFMGEVKKNPLSIEYIDFNYASPFIRFKKQSE